MTERYLVPMCPFLSVVPVLAANLLVAVRKKNTGSIPLQRVLSYPQPGTGLARGHRIIIFGYITQESKAVVRQLYCPALCAVIHSSIRLSSTSSGTGPWAST